MSDRGILYLVATPIGHLGDLSDRARQVLADCDLVAAEDTRRTRQLLTHLGLHKRLLSVHGHNEDQRVEAVGRLLDEGKDVAMVSDGGTPIISDPGQKLVAALADLGHQVVAVPGPCAAIVALTVSGLPADRFTFIGFLPRTPKRANEAVAALVQTAGTLIFYESPRRISGLLERLRTHLGDRRAVLCRELTKVHEEVVRGPLTALQQRAEEGLKGEVVVLVEGATEHPREAEVDEEAVLEKLKVGDKPREIAREVAKRTGLSSQAAYAEVVAIKKRM